MKKEKFLLGGLAWAALVLFAVAVRGDAADEVKRLAELMGWKAGTVVADIGAGVGEYTFAAGGGGGGAGGRGVEGFLCLKRARVRGAARDRDYWQQPCGRST